MPSAYLDMILNHQPPAHHLVSMMQFCDQEQLFQGLFNCSCGGGNLVPVVVRMTGKLVPHVAMVSKRDICQGEELTFMYGAPNPGPEAMKNLNSKSPSDNACKPRRCLCQSPECLGYLPSDALD